MLKLSLVSPAKINRSLQVLGRRPDGFHELATVMQTISLFDRLDLQVSEQDCFTCSNSRLPTDGRNLVIRALELFRQKTARLTPVTIHLTKNIPAEAGLGGGSGNAATMLWALNELHQRPASTEELASWAGEIGSDISFFFSSGHALCTGRGEQVQSLSALPSEPVTIVKPPYGLSTPKVFHALNAPLLMGQTPTLQEYHNDLEAPAMLVEPRLKALKQRILEAGYHTVVMSGSGTSFYCFGEGDESALNSDNRVVQVMTCARDDERSWYSVPVASEPAISS